MAEYCSQCSPFENEFDIDLFRIAIKVKKGHSINLLCEGTTIQILFESNGDGVSIQYILFDN